MEEDIIYNIFSNDSYIWVMTSFMNDLHTESETIAEEIRLFQNYINGNFCVDQCNLEDFSIIHSIPFMENIIAKFFSLIRSLYSVRDMLNEELMKWKKKQQQAANGAEFDISADLLKNLQNWYGKVFEILWFNKNRLNEMKLYPVNDNEINSKLQDISSKLEFLLFNIFNESVVVVEQPSQVLRKRVNTSVKLRLLTIGCHEKTTELILRALSQFEVSIINETQASNLHQSQSIGVNTDGRILNGTGSPSYDRTTNELTITFSNMQLEIINRGERKGDETVVSKKFCLCFSSTFQHEDRYFPIRILSLPVTVTVHVNQESQAWATITWDNAFAVPGRKLFEVPDTVCWGQVADMLDLKFFQATQRHLSDEDKKYLAEKLFKDRRNDYNGMPVSWYEFRKMHLPGTTFSFWDWFYAIMKLMKNYCKDLWKNGLIVGFVSKTSAELLFRSKSSINGSFFIRFSDSTLGGIVIVYAKDIGIGHHRIVKMLGPLSSKELQTSTLADIIEHNPDLQYLYPRNIPKVEAFDSYYTQQNLQPSPRSDGYEKPVLKVQFGS